MTFNPEILDAARLQALVTASPSDKHTAAMLLEAAGRAADKLVIAAPSEIADARRRLTRSQLMQLAFYRGALLLSTALFALVYLHDIGGFLADPLGIRDELVVRRVIAAGAVCGLFLAFTQTTGGVAVALDRKTPGWLKPVEAVGTVIAGVIGAASV